MGNRHSNYDVMSGQQLADRCPDPELSRVYRVSFEPDERIALVHRDADGVAAVGQLRNDWCNGLLSLVPGPTSRTLPRWIVLEVASADFGKYLASSHHSYTNYTLLAKVGDLHILLTTP